MNDWQAPEAEKIFIGSILYKPARLMEVSATADNFLIEAHRNVFSVITQMNQASELIDLITVSDRLTELNAATRSNDYEPHPSFCGGWFHQLTAWLDSALVDSFFYSSQKIIIREYRKREITQICHSLNENYDSDAAIQSLMHLETTEKKHTHTITEALQAALIKAEELSRNGGIVGLPSGLASLDGAIAGFQAPDLYVIGARPAMGKTAVAINLMLSNNCAAGLFSTEQPMEQIGLRSLSIQGGVSAKKIRSADIDNDDISRLMTIIGQVKDRNILIHDKANITIGELMREARQMKFNHDIQVIYVDYIQRIKSPSAENRRLEVADVVTGLKTLARELDIPVIALAQVSREVERRTEKRPRMGDLLESGVIEQEADVVMLLYRDEVYNEGSKDKGVIEILIDKNRHGPTGKLKYSWIGDQMKIVDLNRGNYA
jgi:replicative DNA helicase